MIDLSTVISVHTFSSNASLLDSRVWRWRRLDFLHHFWQDHQSCFLCVALALAPRHTWSPQESHSFPNRFFRWWCWDEVRTPLWAVRDTWSSPDTSPVPFQPALSLKSNFFLRFGGEEDWSDEDGSLLCHCHSIVNFFSNSNFLRVSVDVDIVTKIFPPSMKIQKQKTKKNQQRRFSLINIFKNICSFNVSPLLFSLSLFCFWFKNFFCL